VKRLIAFDLDGTLALSKQALDEEMAELLGRLTRVAIVDIISGGDWPQFEKQVISRMPAHADLDNFIVQPTTGTKLYRHRAGAWEAVYAELFSEGEGDTLLSQVQAALQLISAFDKSPMAGLVDLRRLDVSLPGVIVATTGQGSEITFSLSDPDQQLRRWRQIYDLGLRQQKSIASADLAVANNVPVRWMMASAAPAVVTPKPVKPPKYRRRNV